MNRTLFKGALALLAVVAAAALWQGLNQMRVRSSDTGEITSASDGGLFGDGVGFGSSPPMEGGAMESSSKSKVSSEDERIASRRRVIAAQEKMVEEKRKGLASFLRTAGRADRFSELRRLEGKIEEEETRIASQRSKWIELKNEFEMEVRNLERMMDHSK